MATTHKELLLAKLRESLPLSVREQFTLTMILASPAILAQFTMCMMSYIDAAMVGRLGSAEAAAVGLVSTTTWIFGSFCHANSSGFSVQIAHRCGAGDFQGVGRIFRRGLAIVLVAGLLLCVVGVVVSPFLPYWLGGAPEICADSSAYFMIYAACLPIYQVAVFSEASLIASGNPKVPCMVSMLMCLLDVAFNYLFIFVLGMGVRGAALGTGMAELCCSCFLLSYCFRYSGPMSQKAYRQSVTHMLAYDLERESRTITLNAWRICWPLWLQNLVIRGAFIIATVIIAPLGTVAVAANSFAIIAEGFCYLPGNGIQEAAVTLVGQSLGAGRKALARSFARITITCGAVLMTALAVLMWVFATDLMRMLSSDPEVISLGVSCLRIEAWAEPFFAISIVGYGCCVGAGDTLIPSIINLVSMWAIRIGLALLLIPEWGLQGYWIAMASELSVKGLIFALRIRGTRWMHRKLL